MLTENKVLEALTVIILSAAVAGCGGSDGGGSNNNDSVDTDGSETVTGGEQDGDDDGDGGDGGDDGGEVGVTIFDELVDGDITDDPNNPLPIQLVVGDNFIEGSVVAGDVDYVTVNVPGGSELSQIFLDVYLSENANVQSFIGIQAGSVFTELPANPDVGNLLGFTLFGSESEGDDILPAIGEGEGTLGFSPPLQDGDYTFWINETSPNEATYAFDLVVTPTQ